MKRYMKTTHRPHQSKRQSCRHIRTAVVEQQLQQQQAGGAAKNTAEQELSPLPRVFFFLQCCVALRQGRALLEDVLDYMFAVTANGYL